MGAIVSDRDVRVEGTPMIAKLLRSVRRAIAPNEHDRWQIHSEQFITHLLDVTRNVERPVFVKVGANDGITGDPCGRLFLDNAQWCGVLIEPVPFLAEILAENYSDRTRFTVEQLAIGQAEGSATFYYVDAAAQRALPDLPDYFSMLGSFDREHIVKHLDGVLEPFIVAAAIEVQTLTNALSRNQVERVDILQIDTEGHDWVVLRALDFNRIRPDAIYVEHKHLSGEDRAAMVSFLKAEGFDIRDCGNDFFCLNRQAFHSRR